MDDRYVIRDARPGEEHAIHGLTRAAYAEYARIMDPLAWAGLSEALDAALASSDPAERIVAVQSRGEADRIVGSVLLYPASVHAYDGPVAVVACPEMRLLAVALDQRNRGIGRALVRECARRARESGAPSLGLHTSHSMRTALRMYEDMGFERVPELDFQPPGAELVEGFRLQLSGASADSR